MNWSDERYVKVYVRDTLTWLSLSWEARALLVLLLRKVDGAGVMESGALELAHAVALQLSMPAEVTRRALPELVASGTVAEVAGGLLVVKFVEAQEATKTEARKKKDQRQRAADQRRQAQVIESVETHVPQRPAVSRDVPLCPPPAQPTTSPPPPPPPAQPSSPPAQRVRSRKTRDKPTQVELPTEVVPAPPPPPPKPPNLAARVHAYFLETRAERLEALGLDPTLPDDEPSWPRLAATIQAWALADGGETIERYVELCARFVIDEYLADPYWADAKRRGPDGEDTSEPQPYPLRALMSERQWRKYLEAMQRTRDAVVVPDAAGGVH